MPRKFKKQTLGAKHQQLKRLRKDLNLKIDAHLQVSDKDNIVYKIVGAQENVEAAVQQLSQMLEIVGGPKAKPPPPPTSPKKESQKPQPPPKPSKEASKQVESTRENESATGIDSVALVTVL